MVINEELIKSVTLKAAESPRVRMNYNFHESLDDKCQRMLNVMLVGTKFVIHRHQNTAETFVLLKGKLNLMFYNDKGEETERFLLDPNKGEYGIHIPVGQWHSLEVLEDATIFETREGPYSPLIENDIIHE